MIVRPAAAEEADAVAALINAINSLDGNPPLVRMTAAAVIRDLLGPRPWAELLIADRLGTVVGFILGSALYATERAAGGYFIVDLYVLPGHRRHGAGRALVAVLAALARSRGAVCRWWEVDDGDNEATRFYDALGAVAEDHFTGRLLADAAFDTLADQSGP